MKRRNTKAKLIRDLPKPMAWVVAKYGRVPSPLELAALEYLSDLALVRKSKDEKWALIHGAMAKQHWAELSFLLMCAIQDRDGEALRGLAKLVETFKFPPKGGDDDRRLLLWLRDYCTHRKIKMLPSQVTKAMGHDPGDSDQLRKVRRLLSEMDHFPLRIGRSGRPRADK